MRHVFHTLLALVAGAATAAPFDMQFIDVKGKGVAGTVVTLRSTDPSRPLAKPVPSIMDQVGLQFAPHVLVVPVGSPISFPNSDSVAHQVYSFSPAHPFQLELYKGKPFKPETFDHEGIVTLGCNIHDKMRGYVFVVEAQYYGRTDKEGRWSLPNVEPGEYRLTIWHPLLQAKFPPPPVLEQRVTVSADGTHLKLHAAAPLKLRSESQVPSNWDAY
jgi:plastocyanin